MSNHDSKKLSLIMPKTLHHSLKRVAMEKDTTITAIVLELVDSYLTQPASRN
jgi:hypothetical protein